MTSKSQLIRGTQIPGDKTVGLLVGVKLVFDGIAMLAVAMMVRSVGNSLR